MTRFLNQPADAFLIMNAKPRNVNKFKLSLLRSERINNKQDLTKFWKKYLNSTRKSKKIFTTFSKIKTASSTRLLKKGSQKQIHLRFTESSNKIRSKINPKILT